MRCSFNRVIRAAVMAVVVIGAATAAHAEIIMHSLNFGPMNVPFSTTSVGSLPLFDPNLGILRKVTLELEANTSSGSIAWDNEAPVASEITLGIGAEVTATALTAFTLVAIPLQTGDGMVDADNDGAADFLGTDAFSVVGGSGNDSDMDMSISPATLALFTGIGTFPVELAAGTETFLSTSGGFGPIDPIPGATDGTVKVTYEYNIPEPSTLGLLAMGGLLFARRRR